MEKGKCTIYCTANCKYNNDKGCYKVCEHPKHDGMMCCSKRVYTNGCSLKEEMGRNDKSGN